VTLICFSISKRFVIESHQKFMKLRGDENRFSQLLERKREIHQANVCAESAEFSNFPFARLCGPAEAKARSYWHIKINSKSHSTVAFISFIQ